MGYPDVLVIALCMGGALLFLSGVQRVMRNLREQAMANRFNQLKHSEWMASMRRCDVRGCNRRIPPTGF